MFVCFIYVERAINTYEHSIYMIDKLLIYYSILGLKAWCCHLSEIYFQTCRPTQS